MVIDGAYLLRHRNVRLDRFTRAAENVELIKRNCTDLEMMAFCSWQFNREASKKQKKGKGEEGDLEDIGYSDAIGQISQHCPVVVSGRQRGNHEAPEGASDEGPQWGSRAIFHRMGFHPDVLPPNQSTP